MSTFDTSLDLPGATAMSLIDILYHTPCGVITCAPKPPYTIEQINDLAARWADTNAPFATGLPLSEVVPAAQGAWSAALERACATHESMRLDGITLLWPDGKQRLTTLLCIPLPGGDALTPQAILTLILDTPAVVGQKPSPVEQTQARLERAQETLALMPLPVWLFDARGRLRYVNEGVLKLFDVPDLATLIALVGGTIVEQTARLRPRMTSPSTIARATEKSMTTFTPERYRVENVEPGWASDQRREQAEALGQDELAISRALKKHTVKNQLISVQHPGQDAELILLASATPLIETNGQLAGAVLITDNVTEALLREGQRDAILAMAGHDLRNPLTPAKALLQSLRIKLSKVDEFTREVGYIDRVLDQLGRIEGIAADLDAVAAHGQGDVSAAMASCDLVKLSEEVATKQMERRPETPIVVRASAEHILGVLARKHLERAITMLVDYAARRSPSGRPVTIRLKQMRNQVRVEISDQGDAMPPDQLESLRAVLRLGGAALAMAHGGELDFSTIQTILGLYRSHLYVTSKPRQGTIFSFSLPAPLPNVDLA